MCVGGGGHGVEQSSRGVSVLEGYVCVWGIIVTNIKHACTGMYICRVDYFLLFICVYIG